MTDSQPVNYVGGTGIVYALEVMGSPRLDSRSGIRDGALWRKHCLC